MADGPGGEEARGQDLSQLARSSSLGELVTAPSAPLNPASLTLNEKFLRMFATPGADSCLDPALRTRVREAVPFELESTDAILTRLLRSPTVTRERRPIGEVAARREAREKNDIG